MQLQSIIQQRGVVAFPEFNHERIYMQPFYKKTGLSRGYERWQSLVDCMLDGVDTDGPIYLMVDESPIKAGQTHRRKGLHVDGYWQPALSAHGGGHGPKPQPGRHGGGHGSVRSHSHTYTGGHEPRPHHTAGNSSWGDATFEEPEAIILASSLSAAQGWKGPYDGPVGNGGSCSHISLNDCIHVPMMANQIYVGNVCCLHESLPVQQDSIRQLVRLNVPGWSPTL